MNVSNKRFYYKVFTSAGVYITTWSVDVISNPSFKSVINGGLAELQITLGRKFNSIDETDADRDINFRNEVQLWISDKEAPLGLCIYSGYISDYSPYLDGKDEYIKISVLGYVADLEASDFVDSNGNTAIQYPTAALTGIIDTMTIATVGINYTVGEYVTITQAGTSNDATLRVKTIDAGGGITSYDSFVGGTDYYVENGVSTSAGVGTGFTVNINSIMPSSFSNYDPGDIISDILTKAATKITAGDIDLTGQVIYYVYNNTTARQAIDKAREYSLADWYWYVGADNLLNFKQANTTTPDHTLFIEKHILKIDTQKTMRDLKNEVRFIGGFYDNTVIDVGPPIVLRPPTNSLYTPNTQLYKIYQDAASIATYGKRSHVIIDKSVIDEDTADAQANKFLTENSEPAVRATVEVIDSNGDDSPGYDIESLHPGDTVKIIDPRTIDNSTEPYSLTQIFIIQTVQYDFDKATIELSQRPPWVAMTLQGQINKFIQTNNSSIPTYPSTSSVLAPLVNTNVINNNVVGASNQPGLNTIYDSQHQKVAGFIGKDPNSIGIYGFITSRGYGLMCRINDPGDGADYGSFYVDEGVDAGADSPSLIIELPNNYKDHATQVDYVSNKLKFKDGVTGGSILRLYGNTAVEVQGSASAFPIGAVDLFKPFRLPAYSAASGPESVGAGVYDQEGFMYNDTTNKRVRIYINSAWRTLI